jgi:hypothetical protein
VKERSVEDAAGGILLGLLTSAQVLFSKGADDLNKNFCISPVRTGNGNDWVAVLTGNYPINPVTTASGSDPVNPEDH